MGTDFIQDSDTTRCISNCLGTSRACLEALHHVHSKKGIHVSGKVMELLQLTADTCQLSARMMIANLDFHHQSCELCFEICKATAAECAKYGEDELLVCAAELCRRCAKTCADMAGMTVFASARVSQEASSSHP